MASKVEQNGAAMPVAKSEAGEREVLSVSLEELADQLEELVELLKNRVGMDGQTGPSQGVMEAFMSQFDQLDAVFQQEAVDIITGIQDCTIVPPDR